MSSTLSGLRRRGLTATQLKLFAVVTMFIDHLTFTFLERTYDAATGYVTLYTSDTLYWLDRIGRCIGRQAFPIFAFFIVEGFWHTRSRARYLGRLTLFAVISQLPFHLMCYTGPVGSTRTVGLSVYATLALGLAAIWILDVLFMRHLPPCRLRTLAGQNNVSPAGSSSGGTGSTHGGQEGRSAAQASGPQAKVSPAELALRGIAAIAAVAGICAAAVYLNTDYDYIGVIAIVLFYLLRGNRRAAVMLVWVWITWGSSLEFFALPGLLLLTLYNGQRGGRAERTDSAEAGSAASRGAADGTSAHGSRAGQYAFYLFYPVHMTLLWALRVLICGY